jgi:lipopolysaccharide transport system ATP-binding protein
MKPVIEIKQLGKKYRIRSNQGYLALRDEISSGIKNIFKPRSDKKEDFWALQDVNLQIEQGDRIGIIGKNGAGKSTLLKILSRVTWPTTGEAIIRGRLASLLEVGTGFHPELTGRENIYLNGSILGLKKTEIIRQFDAIVDFSGGEKFLDTPLKHYSSGMQLRLAFAVAAHLEPEILLIDEVLAVGDMEFQKKCLGKMEEVSKQHGRTILFVSHQLNSVIKLCNKGLWLEEGKLKQVGSINEIAEAYTNSINSDHGIAHYVSNPAKADHFFREIKVITPHINVGEDLMLSIGFTEKHKNQRLIININILDESDELISHIINDDAGFSTENTEKKISVTIKEINLLPGRYFLSFWAGYDMQHGIDWVDKAVSFEIDELNNFTRRLTPFPGNSKIIMRSQWQAD